jgi:hypothetical protein
MWSRLKSFQFSGRSIPWMVILVAVLAYGLLTPWLGFYWDDWVFAWLLHFQGAAELARSFLPFDPLISPFFFITSAVLGESTFVWQLFGLVVRILVSLGTLWTLRQIWPRHSRQVTWATFLFLVYPGYGQQWVAFTHANQEWISFGSIILSLGLTARAVRGNASTRWKIYALVTQVIGLATTEYFLGMELLRPLIIWFVLSEQDSSLSRRASTTSKEWLAGYVPIWLTAGIGQYLYHNSPLYGGHSLGSETATGGMSISLVSGILKDFIPTLRVAGFEAWTQTFSLLATSLRSLTDWLVLFLIIASGLVLFFYFSRLRSENHETPAGDSWALQAILLGVVGILAGRIPSWIAGMPIALRFDWDRLLISMMLGASLLVAGLIEYLIRDGRRKVVVVSLLIALAIGMQFGKANSFRRDWQNQQSFFWQLAWRIPSMKPGTMLVTHELPLQYVADLQLTAPLNWIYAPDSKESDLSYLLLYTKNRLGGPFLPRFSPDIPVSGNYRTVSFAGSTSDVIVFHWPIDGCVRVLDSVYAPRASVPGLPRTLTDAIGLSNLGQIENSPENPALPGQYFGSEPAHDWCYYFEKAELARQFGDWQKAVDYYDEATRQGYQAMLPAENLVFVEALGRTENSEQAMELTDIVMKQDGRLCRALTLTWERILTHTPTVQNVASQQLEQLQESPECQ